MANPAPKSAAPASAQTGPKTPPRRSAIRTCSGGHRGPGANRGTAGPSADEAQDTLERGRASPGLPRTYRLSLSTLPRHISHSLGDGCPLSLLAGIERGGQDRGKDDQRRAGEEQHDGRREQHDGDRLAHG